MKYFRHKFDCLHTSVPSSDDSISSLNDRIAQLLPQKLTGELTVSVTDVEKALRKLKAGKSDGFLNLTSDNIKYAPKRLHVRLALLFNSMLVHGFSPQSLLIGTMTPIPMSKNCTFLSDKYQAIALISSIIKTFDYVIILKQNYVFKTDSLQFGFKEGCSTTMCSAMLKEIAHSFNAKGSNVYAVLLDATKTFDRVEFAKMFQLLLDKGMNTLYVRCLLFMYSQQKLCVQWNSITSAAFSVKNGVKQGGVMSPLLFGVYLDTLIVQLRECGFGCYVGPQFCGCLAYADDLVIMSPTKAGLQHMLNVCNKFSEMFKVTFNGAKSQFIVFDAKNSMTSSCTVQFCGTTLSNSNVVIHLGHKIFADMRTDDTEGVISAFYKQFNVFRSKFGNIASKVQGELFFSYCSSFYGSLLLPFKKLEKLCIVWRKSLRQVWRLPYRCHRTLVASIGGGICCRHMLLSRFLRFADSAVHHPEKVISSVMQSAVWNRRSVFSRNLSICCEEVGISLNDFLSRPGISESVSFSKKCLRDCHTIRDDCSAWAIKDLASMRDGLADGPLNNKEAMDFINFLSIN